MCSGVKAAYLIVPEHSCRGRVSCGEELQAAGRKSEQQGGCAVASWYPGLLASANVLYVFPGTNTVRCVAGGCHPPTEANQRQRSAPSM